MADICAVCHRREPTYGTTCTTCRDRIAAGVVDLVRRLATVRRHIVPSSRGLAERVSSSRTGAPLPARLDVLTLTGPGSVAVTALLHPLVRRWSTKLTVTVTTLVDGQPVDTERTLTEWHQELVTTPDPAAAEVRCRCGDTTLHTTTGRAVLVPTDDQVGPVPPAEWLDSWVRAWRRHFDHHVPTRTHVGRRRQVDLVAAARHPAGRAVLAFSTTVAHTVRTHAPTIVLGMTDGHGGHLPAAARSDDPVADELTLRFGDTTTTDPAVAANATYLLRWLDQACERDIGIAEFAGELRALNAELARVLGDTPDQQWLGRCPATITNRDGGQPTSRPCGAGLWQDPHASQVQCPRCRSTWGPRRLDLLHLCAQIRQVWPVDRGRRYTLTDIKGLPVLRCPSCAAAAAVAWCDVTTPADGERWYRAGGVSCPNGCADAGRLL